MTLQVTVPFQVSWSNSNPKDLSTPQDVQDYVRQVLLAAGTGADQADMLFHDQRTIAASGTDDLDLAGGLTDPLTGAALTFARVRAVIVYAALANTNNVVIGNAAANQFVGPFGAAAHTASVRPGGLAVFLNRDATGWAVTAGTGDILRLANSGAGTSVTYDIIIVGCSA